MLAVGVLGILGTPAGRSRTGRIPRPELRPTRISVPPKLDGILDDEAWSGEPLPPRTGCRTTRCAASRQQQTQRLDGLRRRGDLLRVPVPRRRAGEDHARRSAGATACGTTTGSASASTRAAPARSPTTCSSTRAASRWTRCRAATAKTPPPTGCGRAPGASTPKAGRRDPRAAREHPVPRRRRTCAWACCSSGATAASACHGRGRRWRPGKWVFETHAPLVVRRAAASRCLLEVIPSATWSRTTSRALRRAWRTARGARRLRRQREVRHHVDGHARRDDQSRLQPGGERRLRGRGQQAVPGVLQREAAVLHGGAGPVQPGGHRRRRHDADGGAHPPHHRSECRREADRHRGTAYVRRCCRRQTLHPKATGSGVHNRPRSA